MGLISWWARRRTQRQIKSALSDDEEVVHLELCRDFRYLWGEKGGSVQLVATTEAMYVLTDGDLSGLQRFPYTDIVQVAHQPDHDDILSVRTADGLEVVFNHQLPTEGPFFDYVQSRL